MKIKFKNKLTRDELKTIFGGRKQLEIGTPECGEECTEDSFCTSSFCGTCTSGVCSES